ncbi:hypothetical protein STEG23_020484 [Scotinomys teguina]
MARKAGQGKEEEESRARQQEEKTPVREGKKTPAHHGRGHHVVEQGLEKIKLDEFTISCFALSLHSFTPEKRILSSLLLIHYREYTSLPTKPPTLVSLRVPCYVPNSGTICGKQAEYPPTPKTLVWNDECRHKLYFYMSNE